MNKLTTSFYHRFAWTRLGLYLSALTLFCGWAQSAGAATLTTDRLDYPPFSDVTLTGTGFGPNDAVTVAISEVNADGSRTFVQHVAATADAAGSFTATWYIFSDEFGGALLEAIATGNPSGATATALFSDTGPGIAVVSPPTGGFGLDGDLYANTPTANRGDWAPATGGTGGNVLDASGNPLDGATTFHLTDPFSSGTDNNFAGGNKVNDDPNDWTWVSNPVGDKVDMNNALLHFTTDGAGDTWLVFAADRLSDNGDAYIDFEFFQKSLTVTTTPGSSPPAGGFVSAGLDGGRTVNDFILTVSLTKGGTTASFFVERWQAVGAGYDYVDYAPPVGDTFAAVNTAVVSSPYSAFGGSTYAKNTFAEAAVNLTKLIGSFNPCLSLGIKTVLVKTKVSQSPTAGMVDFISPLQVSLTLGVANAGQGQSKCSEGTSTSFALSGTATPSPGQTVSSTTWSVVAGTGSATIDTPGNLNTSVAVSSPSVTMRLTVVTAQGCTATNDVVLTVKPKPTCSIDGATILYAGSIGSRYTAPADAGSYSWSLAGDAVDNGFLTDISGETSQILSFNVAGGASGSFTVTLTRTGDNGCISTCFTPVEIKPLADGCLIDGPLTVCAGQQNVQYNLNAVDSASSITWSLNPNTSAAVFDPAPPPPDDTVETVFVDAGVAGSYTVNVTVIYPGGTLNCSWDTTVNSLPPCSITGPVGPVCPNSSGNIYSVPEGPDGTLYAWTIDAGSIVGSSTGPSVSVTAGSTCGASFTLNVTVTFPNGCPTTCTKTVSVNDPTAPVLTKGSIETCYPTVAAAEAAAIAATTGSDNCSGVTKTASTVGTCSATVTVTGTDACGNHAEVSYATHIDNLAPVLSGCPQPSVTVQCLADVPLPANVTANDNCDGTLTPTFTETPSGTDCDKTITRTWTVADTCGNPASCTQVIHVKDDTAPVLTKGSIETCYATVAAAEAAAIAATTGSDNCSGVTKTASTVGTCSATVTVTGTDACGNHAEVSYTTHIDNLAPVLSGCPQPSVTVQCLADVPLPANVTANDNCDGTLTPTFTETPSGTDCDKTITRTWTVADTCGNPASCTQVIHVKDDTAPVLTKGSIGTCYATVAAAEAAAIAATTGSDNCSGVTKTASTVGTCSATVTVTGTDACGNHAEVSYTTHIDNLAPVLSGCPQPSVTVQCLADVPLPANVTANDNCDGPLTPTFTETPSGTDCDKTITRTWTVADTCGNPASCTQVIHVKDDTAPVLTKGSIETCYPTVAAAEAAAIAATTGSDNCSGVTKTASTVGTCSATVTVTGTDACGNHAEVSYTTHIDNLAPVLSGCPQPSVTVQCLADVPLPANVTANDNCDGPLTPTFTETPSGTDCDKTITRTWTVVDSCGIPASCTQVIHVKDDTAPVLTKGSIETCYPTVAAAEAAAIAATTGSDNCSGVTKTASTVGTCSATVTVTGTDACGNHAEVSYTTHIDNLAPVLSGCPQPSVTVQCLADVPLPANVTANDNCDGPLTPTFTETPSGTDCDKTITRTWTVVDSCGIPASCTQVIHVKDDTAPVLTKGSIGTCYATVAAAEAAAIAATTGSDNCSGVTKTASTVGTCSATVTVTGTDACGNHAEVSYTTRIDNLAPVLSGCPQPSVTVQCLADVPLPANVTANDNCDGPLTPTFTETPSGTDCDKTITRTWTVVDSCGIPASCTQVIHVKDDTAPVLTKGSIGTCYPTVAAAEAAAIAATTGSDNCSGVTKTASTVGTCSATVTVTGTDACGNHAEVSYTTRIDNLAPVLSGCPQPSVTVQCLADVPLPANVTANDNCDGPLTPTFTETPSGTDCDKTITRTWTVVDSCGIPASCTQVIHVKDDTAPVLTKGSIETCYPTVAAAEAAAIAATTGSDNCSGVTKTASTVGTCSATVTVTGTDACGNHAEVSYATRIDNLAPVLSGCPAVTTSYGYQCLSEVPAAPVVTATDNCDSYVAVYFNETQSNPGSSCHNVIRRTWTATDRCGNPAYCTQTITVNDTTNPVLSGYPAPTLSVQCVGEVPEPAYVTANDNCGGALTPYFNETSTGSDCDKTITRTWTVQDACGNPASCSQTIRVKDTKAPVITCPKDYIAHCGSGKCGTNPELTGKATATDNCGGAVTPTYTDSGTANTNNCEWTIYRTWKATDACGNTSTCLQKIMCVSYSKAIVTDSSLCSYDWDPSTTCKEFRLLFTPYGSGYKINASNPGQTYYNVFYVAPAGTPVGTPVTLTLKIPYPYVTQGANPIHAYDDVDVTGSNPTSLCLVNLGNPVAITSVTPPPPITLGSYGNPPAAFTSVTVTMPLPATEFIYLNMHLDYGLKGTFVYAKGGPSGNDAVSQTTGKVVIPDKTNYVFSVGGDVTDADGICNMNVFKKNPGVGGRCGYRYTVDGVSDIIATPNATVTLKDAKGTVLATGKTDEDGWYMLSYKWTGKAATLIVTVQPVGKPAQSKSITLKANGFVEVNFDVP